MSKKKYQKRHSGDYYKNKAKARAAAMTKSKDRPWFAPTLMALLGIAVLILPSILFSVLVGTGSGWVVLGVIGGFFVGIGLFNYVAIFVKQHLGHRVSIVFFLLGGVMMLVSWLLCR